ncbi:MAG TPA: hypothetical protein PLA68_12070, partial [Panacibacter sp.]|nr:hypothetical protein [Panacibacter sp.]
MAERKIRVGLIIEDFNVQAWIYIMLEKIIQSDFAEIVLIANSNINSPGIKKKKPAFSLINLYLKQERKLSKQKKSYTLRPVASIIENIPLINVSITKSNDGSVEIKDDDVNKIEKYEADVLINLDLPYLKGKILNAAVCGVWAYDPMLRFDNNLFLQQIKEDDCSVSVTLKMFTEGFSSGRVLYKSFSAGTIVFNKNINWLYWKAASFIPRKLKELHEDGATVFLDKAKNRIETGSNDTGYKSNFSFLSKHFSRLVKTITGNALQFEQWVLLYCFPQTDQQLPLDISKYREITPPKDR